MSIYLLTSALAGLGVGFFTGWHFGHRRAAAIQQRDRAALTSADRYEKLHAWREIGN